MRRPTDLVPHRPPWLVLDRVQRISDGSVVADKLVSAGDPYVVAGALAGLLVVELAAQAAACMMGDTGRAGHRGYLVAARGWKFPSAAVAGERVELHVERASELGPLRGFRCRALVGERLVAAGDLTCAVHFDDDAASAAGGAGDGGSKSA
jgi:3-hydroxyacyl-[acyl-carrier-protein] dehydratase